MMRVAVLSLVLAFGCMNNVFAAAERVSTSWDRHGAGNNKLGGLLLGAATSNNVSKVKELIAQKVSVDYMNILGNTALKEASMNCNVAAVAGLLQARASVDLRRDDSEATPLLLAIRIGSMCAHRYKSDFYKTIQLLVWAGADFECTYKGACDNVGVDLSRFPEAVSAIHEALADRALAADFVEEENCLQPYLVPIIVQLIKEYVAMPFTALDIDGENVGFMVDIRDSGQHESLSRD